MANYLTTDTDLTAVADAIRTKGGTSAQLAFPADFVQAIEDIETGGGGGDTITKQSSYAKVTVGCAIVTAGANNIISSTATAEYLAGLAGATNISRIIYCGLVSTPQHQNNEFITTDATTEFASQRMFYRWKNNTAMRANYVAGYDGKAYEGSQYLVVWVSLEDWSAPT
jgi:hypothetical protein